MLTVAFFIAIIHAGNNIKFRNKVNNINNKLKEFDKVCLNMSEVRKAISEMNSSKLIKVVISNKMKSDVEFNKIVFLLKEKKGNEDYQMERYTDKHVFHENVELDKGEEKLEEYIENK